VTIREKEEAPLVNDAIPIGKLEDPAVRQLVVDAAIVIGRDSRDGHETAFYGRPMLKYIASSQQPAAVKVVRFVLDFGTDELEYLSAAVQVLKGRDDYESDLSE
jgi:hypothetical protein